MNRPIPFATTALPDTHPSLNALGDAIIEAAVQLGFDCRDAPDTASAVRQAKVRLVGIEVLTPFKRDIGLALEIEGLRTAGSRVRLIVHPGDERCFTEAEGIDLRKVLPGIPAGHPHPPAVRYYAPGSAPALASLLLSAVATAAG